MACRLPTFTTWRTLTTAISLTAIRWCWFGAPQSSSQTFTAIWAGFKRSITFREAMRLPERIVSTRGIRVCRPSTVARTLTSCRLVITAPSKTSSSKMKCARIATSSGSWSLKHPARAKESRWSPHSRKCRVALGSHPVSCNSTSTTRSW